VETAPAQRWSIAGARHVGVTVSDLDRSLEFYVDTLGMELLWRRLYEEPEIAEIVGVPEATAFDIAMLRVPGGELEIELLEYRGCDSRSASARPCDHGSGHFALFVHDVDALHADLAARGVRFRSAGPVEMSAGANKGGKSLYSHDPDGYVIEFHERPR
jgi:catechol 2,3-dioxygenase-like lactoylglutathione lyase family enzyme